MKKIRLLLTVFFIIALLGVCVKIAMIFYPWIILPVESTPDTLTIVKNGGSHIEKIILKQHLDDECCEYELELKSPLYECKPQEYPMPIIKNGRVEVVVEFDDAVLTDGKKSIKVIYNDAKSLCEKGLLIYSEANLTESVTIENTVYYDQYIHIVSGDEKETFKETAGESDWKPSGDDRNPKSKVKKDMSTDFPDFKEWKELNEWEFLSN